MKNSEKYMLKMRNLLISETFILKVGYNSTGGQCFLKEESREACIKNHLFECSFKTVWIYHMLSEENVMASDFRKSEKCGTFQKSEWNSNMLNWSWSCLWQINSSAVPPWSKESTLHLSLMGWTCSSKCATSCGSSLKIYRISYRIRIPKKKLSVN